MTPEERALERRKVLRYFTQPESELLIRVLHRQWRDGPPNENEAQMLKRLGRLEALADLERLREEAIQQLKASAG